MTAVITIVMPAQRLLRHFPEAIALAILDAALVAVELALREEHPVLENVQIDPERDISPLPLTAYLIVTRAIELRELVRLYSRGVERTLGHHLKPDPYGF